MKFVSLAAVAALSIASTAASAQSYTSTYSSFGQPNGFVTTSDFFNPEVRTEEIRNQREVRGLFESGYIHLKADRYNYAATLFGKAADNSAATSRVSYMAGASNFLAGNSEEAKLYLKQALRRNHFVGITSRERKIARQMLREIGSD